MEIEKLITQLSADHKLVKKEEEITSNSIFIDLMVTDKEEGFTIQYNERGLISVYYRNSQFYDEPDEVLRKVITAIIDGNMVPREDKEGHVYYCVQQESGSLILPTRYTQGT